MNEHIPGTKIAERLFCRPEGATMAEVVAATGGRQHNLLERLKARGYTVRSRKEGRTTRYWATAKSAPAYEATITTKGQVTVPKEVREQLGIQPGGGRIEFVVGPDGKVTVSRPSGSIEELFGILGKPKRRVTLEQMDRAIREAAVQRYLRSIRRK